MRCACWPRKERHESHRYAAPRAARHGSIARRLSARRRPGLLEISHNTLALLGLAVVAVTVFAAGQSDVRHQVEAKTLEWLQGRHEARALESGDVLSGLAEQGAVTRAPPSRLKTPPGSTTSS
jgi:hypothetical protein